MPIATLSHQRGGTINALVPMSLIHLSQNLIAQGRQKDQLKDYTTENLKNLPYLPTGPTDEVSPRQPWSTVYAPQCWEEFSACKMSKLD